MSRQADTMKRNILESSLKNASFSILFQILSRVLTFGINAFIVRRIGREVLGIMNVRLLLLESTLIFLSREAICRAALSSRTQHTGRASWPQLINQMWITVPICMVLCVPFGYIWLNVLSPVDVEHASAYRFGCLAIAISCVLEMCSEAPAFVGQVFLFVRLKIVLDTVHILVRSAVFLCLVLTHTSSPIYAFGTAQLASALTIVGGNYAFFYVYARRLGEFRSQRKRAVDAAQDDEEKSKNERALRARFGPAYEHMDDFPFGRVSDMLPGRLHSSQPNERALNGPLQKLVFSFAKQGCLKQVLTEGEKYVMSVSPVLSFSEQATYDIVNNMGSLAARFIFRPIEESGYFYFTQTIARDVPLEMQPEDKVELADRVLHDICRAVSSIGLLAFVFGQSYAGTVLLLYGGPDFVAGGLPEQLLRWHSVAIVLLAVNGITEGFMFATNTSAQIDQYNYFMAFFSVSFLALSYQLTNWFGPVGFILANCTNMAFRIIYSTHYIRMQFRQLGRNPLSGCLPTRLFVGVLVACGVMCKWSEVHVLPHSVVYHLLLGVFGTLLTVFAWARDNRRLYLFDKILKSR